jgi:valyl-tRNA synthetase
LGDTKPQQLDLQDIDIWILTKFSQLVKKCNKQMDEFNYAQTMKDVEYFLWHEVADHYLEMIKESYHTGKNIESIQFTLYTLGLGMLKLFAPFFPHITEELYQNHYRQWEKDASIHLSSWPEPLVEDKDKLKAGETVKQYIAQVRSWKSEQGLALNAPLTAMATYASKQVIHQLEPSEYIIKSTLKLPDNHQFIVGKPEIEERITKVTPVYSLLGPQLKQKSKPLIAWIQRHQDKVIQTIESKGDIYPSDIPDVDLKGNKGLLEQGFIEVKKETMKKGEKTAMLISFDQFYLEHREK